jgi:nicotinamidase-related amidase
MPNPKTALLIVDVQKGFDDPRWGRRNNPAAEAKTAEVLAAWRRADLLVFHARHLSTEPGSPLAPGSPGSEIKESVLPEEGEPVVEKRVNSCFIGTDFEERLRRAGIDALATCGLTTDHCVSTTARMAANLGFKTYVVSDACATFDRRGPDGKVFPAEEVHEVALASLHGEFAEVVASDRLLSGPEKGRP